MMIHTAELKIFRATSVPLFALAFALALITNGQAADPIRVLIVDGQNNHDWKKTTPILKACLEATGRFQVDVATSPRERQTRRRLELLSPQILGLWRGIEQLQRRVVAAARAEVARRIRRQRRRTGDRPCRQ